VCPLTGGKAFSHLLISVLLATAAQMQAGCADLWYCCCDCCCATCNRFACKRCLKRFFTKEWALKHIRSRHQKQLEPQRAAIQDGLYWRAYEAAHKANAVKQAALQRTEKAAAAAAAGGNSNQQVSQPRLATRLLHAPKCAPRCHGCNDAAAACVLHPAQRAEQCCEQAGSTCEW
jgi:hypothetical protein